MDRFEKLIDLLQEAEKSSRCGDNASFGELHMTPVTLSTPAEVDAFVKERIRLYMGSWVTGPIVHALEILKVSQDLEVGINELATALRHSGLSAVIEKLGSVTDSNRQLLNRHGY